MYVLCLRYGQAGATDRLVIASGWSVVSETRAYLPHHQEKLVKGLLLPNGM